MTAGGRGERRRLFDVRLAQSLSHPIRVEILNRLQDRIASPIMLQRELGEHVDLSYLSYHVRVLARFGAIEKIRTEQRRGAIESFYRAIPNRYVGADGWRAVPRSIRGSITGAALRGFLDKALAAVDAGVVDDREDTIFNWTSLTVDAVGWAQAVEIMRGAWSQLMAVDQQSKERLAALDEDGTQIVAGIAGFEAAPRDGGAK